MHEGPEQRKATMKLAHVLFMDIVDYSKLPTDQQSKAVKSLQEIVRGTAEVKRAQTANDLITLATGDGMALVFFSDPMAPVQCALEVSKALKGHPDIKLRMGVHSGPVDEVVDVNDRVNVAGAGINMAQRVMDSGDAGHILVSRRVAEDLAQYSSWQPFLHDLEEVEVKHGVRMHVFNLYTGEAGNAELPQKVRKGRKRSRALPAAAVAAVAVIIAGVAYLLLRNRPQPLRPDAELTAVLQKKADAWVDGIFTAQAPNGGVKSGPSAADTTVQVWTTAQCMTGVLSTQKSWDHYAPKIKSAFDYIQKLRRTTPSEGWNYYGNANPYTVTEINSWVTLAHIRSLDSKTSLWNETERSEVVNRIVRDLEELKRRQDPNGGWRPIRDQGSDYVRTYSTIIALWSLIEARKASAVSARMGPQYDETIRSGINWLLRTHRDGLGWVQNPDRAGQKEEFEGLTAQVLYVLSRAEVIPDFAFLRNDQVYRTAERDFLNNKSLAQRSIDKDNSHIPDVDVGFPNSEFMAEGSTFLWFPWTLLELTHLATDDSLTADERATAAQLRREILNANFDKLGNYVESANLSYIFAENLFCVSQYLHGVQAVK